MGEGETDREEEPQWDDARYYDDIFSASDILIPLDPQPRVSRTPATLGGSRRRPNNGNNIINSRKRARELADDPDHQLAQSFPQVIPRVPILEERRVEEIDEKTNPFCSPEGVPSAHPRTIALSRKKNSSNKVQERTAVNGLVKFILWKTNKPNKERSVPGRADSRPLWKPGNQPTNPNAMVAARLDPNNQVNYLPQDFGRTIKLDYVDQTIFRFYTVAVCSGRTLLDKQNIHLLEIAPMADKSEGVRHAVLSLASSYLLDYRPDPVIAAKANQHYRLSIEWLTKELRNTENYEPGKEEALVTTLVLLIHSDIVCCDPESSASEKVPAWYQATRLARRVLDSSDPGYCYKRLQNVQESKARHKIGNEVAFSEILSSAFAPIEEEDLKPQCPYSWLMSGNDKECTKIEGNTGMCAKVLYSLAQITYLTGAYAKDSRAEIWPIVAGKVRTRLERVEQWSELSPGYSNAQDLLDSCILDDDGLVKTKEEATDLIAQCYIQAALIYLECRFFRRTPFDPSVRRHLDILIKCFDRCPTSGDLYTAQTPVFGVAIAGVVAIDEEERDFCRKYVRGTCAAGERGNLSTLGDTLKFIWEWMDKYGPGEGTDSPTLPNRRQWWEELVAAFYKTKNRRDFA